MNDELIDMIINRYKNFKKKRKSFNVYNYVFHIVDDEGDCGIIDLGARVFIVSPEDVDNCAFWIHEFSELTVIGILTREKYSWRKSVQFKGYNCTYIAHFITPMGVDNKCCLVPQTNKDKKNW